MKARLKILPNKPRSTAWRSPARDVNCPVKSGKPVSDTMSKKLKLSPSISYLLGMYGKCAQERSASIAMTSSNASAIEKAVKISMDELGISPNKLLITEFDDITRVMFYNSKLRKLFDDALSRKMKIFKHPNDYAAEYIAGMFDAIGAIAHTGMYLSNIDPGDYMIIDTLGIHILQKGNRYYIINESMFTLLISKYSMKLLSIAHGPGNERDPR